MTKMEKEFFKAGAFVSGGAGAGLVKGGAIGIAGFGSPSVPLVVAGAVAGLAGYVVYKVCESCLSDSLKEQNTKKKQRIASDH